MTCHTAVSGGSLVSPTTNPDDGSPPIVSLRGLASALIQLVLWLSAFTTVASIPILLAEVRGWDSEVTFACAMGILAVLLGGLILWFHRGRLSEAPPPGSFSPVVMATIYFSAALGAFGFGELRHRGLAGEVAECAAWMSQADDDHARLAVLGRSPTPAPTFMGSREPTCGRVMEHIR